MPSSSSSESDQIAAATLRKRSRLDFNALQWAWEFLRRNPEYRKDYDRIKHVPELWLGRQAMDENDEAVLKLSTDWFDLEPCTLPGERTLGEWLARVKKGGRSWYCEVNSRSPLNYLIEQWMDPNEGPLPAECRDYFCADALELEQDDSLLSPGMGMSSPLDRKERLGNLAVSEVPSVQRTTPSDEEVLRQILEDHGWIEDSLPFIYSGQAWPTTVPVKFDLLLPIEPQISQARRDLREAVRLMRKNSPIGRKMPKWAERINKLGAWSDMLDLLDIRETVDTDAAAFEVFFQTHPGKYTLDTKGQTLESNLRTARFLRDRGYRGLIMDQMKDEKLRWEEK